jgi:NADPH:quinone reductase-like Zn-dependent oxidoreductase
VRALAHERYGEADALALVDLDVPEPRPGEVRVRVLAASLNDWDLDLLRGRPVPTRLIAPLRRRRVLGSDLCGVVDRVGPGATRWSVGDVVVGDLSPHGFAGLAEYAVAPETAWSPKPSRLSPVEAAALPQAGGLAVTMLRAKQPLGPQHRVLVNGAGGGVGTFAVQIARACGARVTAVDSAGKLAALLELGADEVLDFGSQDAFDGSARYDLVAEVSARRSVTAYRRALLPGGVCSIIGGTPRAVLTAVAAGAVVSAFSDVRIQMPLWRANDPRDVSYLHRLVDEGAVTPVIDTVVPLDSAREGVERLITREHIGKVVVQVSDLDARDHGGY